MLQFLYAQASSERLAEAVGFAHWAAGSAPPGSALHVLPLYVRVERYRRGAGPGSALDLHWVAEDAIREADRAHDAWFARAPAEERTPLDLNHLAHALWGALRFEGATEVFDALGPYYTPLPWSYRADAGGERGQGAQVFLQARARSRSATHGP
ncbi:conserved hypothetical protein [Streptomyces sviceus ATCC 29083]|uniref:Uncharacterized protein n=2 Tax=Streptomyces TaxID=1883 RepID=D6XB72_STRX2|nr:conserved hypothetical protein [Streptomyces sviceus ATCC 29083]